MRYGVGFTQQGTYEACGHNYLEVPLRRSEQSSFRHLSQPPIQVHHSRLTSLKRICINLLNSSCSEKFLHKCSMLRSMCTFL